jgi:hypothetical protein
MNDRRRSIGLGLAAAVLAATAGCAGSLFKVKPPVTTPMPADARNGTDGALAVNAVPLLTDEESQELFEVNLPLSGVLPVRVEMTNTGAEAINLSRAKIAVRDFTGQQWKLRTAKQTAARVLDYYDVYIYNPSSRKEFLAAMQLHGFDTKSPLAPGERRTGILFFESPRKEPVDHPAGLVLSADKLPGSIAINLN